VLAFLIMGVIKVILAINKKIAHLNGGIINCYQDGESQNQLSEY
jgi:hypothetical protein